MFSELDEFKLTSSVNYSVRIKKVHNPYAVCNVSVEAVTVLQQVQSKIRKFFDQTVISL